MATRSKLVTNLAMVVDLAVQHAPDRRIFVADRLMSAGDIDDAQPPHSQPNPREGIDIHAFIIRTAVLHQPVHPKNAASIAGTSRSADAAHAVRPSAGRPRSGQAASAHTNQRSRRPRGPRCTARQALGFALPFETVRQCPSAAPAGALESWRNLAR